MARRGLPNIPMFTGNMARAAGGAGYGIADAGKAAFKLGQSMEKAKQWKDEFGQEQSRIAMEKNNADRDYRLEVLKYNRDGGNDAKINEYAGMAYANTHPNDPMLTQVTDIRELGKYAREMKPKNTERQLTTVKTDDGIMIFDKRTGDMSPTGYKPPKTSATPAQQALQDIRTEKARRERILDAEANYGSDEWRDFSTGQKKYILGQYAKEGIFPRYKTHLLSPNNLEGYQEQGSTEKLDKLKQILKQQEAQLRM